MSNLIQDAYEQICGDQREILVLREQVEKLKAELKSIDGALNDPRANLTLTTSEIIWELKGQVEKLTKERDEYRLKYQIKADKSDTYSREASTHEDTIEFATGSALSIANYLHQHFFDDVPQWRPLDDLIGLQTQISNMVTGIGEQLAALAEQNEKMRSIPKWIGGDWADSIRSLPDLATPVLNKYRVEGMRMASEIIRNSGALEDGDYVLAIRARAAELEKTNG